MGQHSQDGDAQRVFARRFSWPDRRELTRWSPFFVGPAIADRLTVYARMFRKSGPFGNPSFPTGRTTRPERVRGPMRPGHGLAARPGNGPFDHDHSGHRVFAVAIVLSLLT
jgi:hypothetical protein